MKTTQDDDYPFGFIPLNEEEIEAKRKAYQRKERRNLKKQLVQLLAETWAKAPQLRRNFIERIARRLRREAK